MSKGLHRELVPVVVGVVLGGLLTGIPTLWVAQSQLRTQVELAARVEREQSRQRRLQAAKNFLMACSDGALLTERLARAVKDHAAFRTILRDLQHTWNRQLVASAEVFAEFPVASKSLPEFGGVLGPGRTESSKAALSDDEWAQRLLAKAQQYDSHCRSLVSTLLQMLTSDAGSKN